MENPLAIANFFIQKSIASGQPVTPMKLIKLVYLSHGWYLALTGNALLSEDIQAWKYGPVVQSVYQGAKKFRNQPIDSVFTGLTGQPLIPSAEVLPLLEKIWEIYGKYDALQLSALTHKEGSPWYRTWNDGGGSSSVALKINNDLIKEYYRSQMNPPLP